MKKRILLGFLTLIAVLLVGAAACGSPSAKQYTVTLDYEAEQGTVSLSPDAENGKYDAGTEVTVTVTPKEDYAVDKVTVDGAEAELVEGAYTFKVQKDVTVKATFTEKPAIVVLRSLRGSVVFEGTQTVQDFLYESIEETQIKTTFDSARRAVLIEKFAEDGEPTVWLFREDDGDSTEQLTHDMDGKLQTQPHDHPFSSLYNPFELLLSSDLKQGEDHTWTVEDPDKLGAICNAILGYSDTVESFVMHEEDGKIVRLEIVFERITSDSYVDEQYSCEFTVKEQGTASIDPEYFTDYALTPAHDALKTALEAAAAAENYTVTLTDEAGETVTYYTPDGIYIESAEFGTGYVVRPDGNVWNYDCEDGEFFFNEPDPDAPNLAYFKALFSLSDNNGDYSVLLKSLGDGAFAARAADIYDSYCEVSAFFGQQFATGPDQIEQLSSAVSFSLTIENGALRSVVCDISEAGRVTLTFSGWDETELPVSVPADVLKGLVASDYCGDWVSEFGDTVLHVTLDGIALDGEDAEGVASAQGGGYTFTVADKTYTAVKGEGTLTLTSDGEPVTLYPCPWFAYIGTFLGVDEEKNDVDVVITAKGISVKVGDGQPQIATEVVFEKVVYVDDDGYVEQVGQFTFNLGDQGYVLQQAGYGVDQLVFAKEEEQDGIGLYRDQYEQLTDWSDLVGDYSGEGYAVKLEDDKLTVTHEGVATVITEITYYKDYDYNTSQEFYQFSFTYAESACVLEVMDHALLFVVGADDRINYKAYYLMEETYAKQMDLTSYYGVYSGDGYTVEIGANGVTVQVGTAEKIEATVVYYAETETTWMGTSVYLILKVEGKTYYLTVYPGSSAMLDDGSGLYAFLYPQADEG